MFGKPFVWRRILRVLRSPCCCTRLLRLPLLTRIHARTGALRHAPTCRCPFHLTLYVVRFHDIPLHTILRVWRTCFYTRFYTMAAGLPAAVFGFVRDAGNLLYRDAFVLASFAVL
jgi:hypothetical protein